MNIEEKCGRFYSSLELPSLARHKRNHVDAEGEGNKSGSMCSWTRDRRVSYPREESAREIARGSAEIRDS